VEAHRKSTKGKQMRLRIFALLILPIILTGLVACGGSATPLATPVPAGTCPNRGVQPNPNADGDPAGYRRPMERLRP